LAIADVYAIENKRPAVFGARNMKPNFKPGDGRNQRIRSSYDMVAANIPGISTWNSRTSHLIANGSINLQVCCF
jgi:hypothetical protein